MAFKLNGKPLPIDVPFTSNGINYPANWLRLSDNVQRNNVGITEVPDPPWYDQRFYTDPTTPKSLTDQNVKDKEGNDLKDDSGNPVIAKGLKTIWVATQKEQASTFLSKSDWYVTRKSEKGTEIPTNIQTYRDAVRTACTTRETEINGAADVAALKTLIEGTITKWPEEVS